MQIGPQLFCSTPKSSQAAVTGLHHYGAKQTRGLKVCLDRQLAKGVPEPLQ